MRANRLLLVAVAWVLAWPSRPIWAGHTWGGDRQPFPLHRAYAGGLQRRWVRRGARLLPLVAACLLAAAPAAAAAQPALPARPSGSYLAFAGRAPAYERRLGTSILRLRNAAEGGRPVLVVTVNG